MLRQSCRVLVSPKLIRCLHQWIPKNGVTAEMSPKTDEEKRRMEEFPYRSVVGRLVCLATTSRPDLANVVRSLSRFMANPGLEHYAAAKVLRYLSGTRSKGLTYHGKQASLDFQASSDANWGQSDNGRSGTGYVIELACAPIAWSLRLSLLCRHA